MQGIPIDELIAWNEKLRKLQNNARVTAPEPDVLMKATPVSGFDELAFIRGVERDFAGQAEGVLQRLNLSHLFVQPQK